MEFPTYPLTTRIAQDSFILEMIFNRFEDGLMSNLHVRSVCKEWNRLCLKLVEKEHRRIDIRLVCGKHTNQYVYVNWRPVQRAMLECYFDFLTCITGVQVEEVKVERGFELGYMKEKEFHDSILKCLIKDGEKLKKVTGLTEICKLCDDCLNLAKRCSEFGPISKIKKMIGFEQPKHFKRLIVDDLFLESIANHCVNNSRSVAQCDKVLIETVTKMNIACSKLFICLDEARPTRHSSFDRDQINFPRPVLDAILKIWRVKTVEIKPINNGFTQIHNDEWTLSKYLQCFRFNNPSNEALVLKESVKIPHVHLDLSESLYWARDLGSQLPDRTVHRGYENSIANIKKVFKCDEISIDIASRHAFNRAFVENILRVSRLSNHENLRLNIQMLADNLSIVNGKIIVPNDLERYRLLDPPNPLYIRGAGSDPKRFKTKKYIGTRCKFVDSLRNLKVNVNVFKYDVNDVL